MGGAESGIPDSTQTARDRPGADGDAVLVQATSAAALNLRLVRAVKRTHLSNTQVYALCLTAAHPSTLTPWQPHTPTLTGHSSSCCVPANHQRTCAWRRRV